MSELYDHIHEDRSEERPTSVWYNDDTRVKTFEIEDAHTLHPTGPRSESQEYKSFAERGSWDDGTRERIARNNAVRTEPWTRWVEDDHSDSESDDDDNGRMEKLHTMMESAQKPQKCIMVAVVNAHGREGCVTECGRGHDNVHGRIP
jgi:hypothetical protein